MPIKRKIIHSATATGEKLTYEAPEGRPSGDGVVVVLDPRYPIGDARHTITSGTAARKAIVATITDAAGVSQTNRRNVPCVPPAALKIGDPVFLLNSAKQQERSRVRKIDTISLEVEDELVWDYDAPDLVHSAEMTSPSLPDAFLQSDLNLGASYSARWTYTVDGRTYVHTTEFDLVRQPFEGFLPDDDLAELQPDLPYFAKFRNTPANFDPLKRAARKDVEMDLHMAGYDPDRVRGTAIVGRLEAKKFFALLAMTGAHPNGVEPDLYIEKTEAEYDWYRQQVISQKLKIPYDANEDDALSPTEMKGTAAIVLVR